MKLLTIGLDGGDRRIIEKMPMPFLKSLLEGNKAPKLTGDLLSRGWAEIYTGRHALETGALYMHPCLDGTHKFTQSFNLKTIEKAGVKAIWERLNEAGVTTGVMNIPTTSPAPAAKGFHVAGGGGGIAKTEGLPRALADSEETLRLLEEMGYDPDMRLGGGGVDTATRMFDILDAQVEVRRKAFLALCERHRPDFGFLCFRVTTEVQYVAMAELEAIMSTKELDELGIGPEGSAPRFNPVQERILQHYHLLDDQLRQVFEALSPKSYLFCADHGASRYLYRGNANPLLERHGYLHPISAKERKLKGRFLGILRGAKEILPKVVQERFRKNTKLIKAVKQPFKSQAFDPRRTRAFGHFYVAGIYINDLKRFGGPVAESELDALVDEICGLVNADEQSREHKLKAVPYRRLHRDSVCYDKLPDIFFEKEDELFFTGEGDEFIRPNPNYGPLPENLEGVPDMNAGQKSRHPLFAYSDDLAALVRDDDSLDLRLVCHLIGRSFELPDCGEA